MNIAFLSTAFLNTMKESTSITLVSLARALMKRGHTVAIITNHKKGLPSFESIWGVPIYRFFNGRILGPIRGVRRLQKKLGITFDVIHGFSAAPVLGLWPFLAKLFYAKHATTIHTIKSYPRRFGLHLARLLNLVDAVTVSTNVVKKKFLARGVRSGKICTIRSFIDTTRFFPKDKTSLKKKYGFANQKVVFYYGSLYDKKGVKYLLRAFPAVLRRYPHALLVLALRHGVPQNYAYLIAELGLSNHIRVIIDDVDITDYVNLADVLVLPYIDMVGTEGNPSCLLEAVACKTPIVTTKQPELLEIFGQHALFYAPACDAQALAHQIVLVLKNKKEADERANRAFSHIQEFDVETVAVEFLELYKSP